MNFPEGLLPKSSDNREERRRKTRERIAWLSRPGHVLPTPPTVVEKIVYVDRPVYVDKTGETPEQQIIETYAEPGETPEQTRTRLNDVWFHLNQRFIALSRGEKWPEPLTDSEHTLMNELSIFARG